MKFISANRNIGNHSLDQVRGKVEKNASLIIHPETVDQIDHYEVKMRVHIRGRGQGFHIEVPTVITLEEKNRSIQIIAHSDLSKPLIIATGLAVTCAITFSVTNGYGVAIFSFLVVFPTMLISLSIAIRRRAAELLKVLVSS